MNNPARLAALLAGSLAALAACNTTGPAPTRPVAIRLTAAAPSVAGAAAAAGPLTVSALQLVIGRAALGSGDQFGCVDCQGNTEDALLTPKLIDVPLAGGAVTVAIEQVSPGHYTQAEIGLEPPTAGSTVPATWPTGATIRIAGTYNGTAFEVALPVQGDFRAALTPAVDLATTGGPATVDVTITLPVESWFTANGTALDPANPAQRALIDANVRAAFQPSDSAGEKETSSSEGVGASARPEGANYSLTAQAARIAVALDALHVHNAILIAHAIGASEGLRPPMDDSRSDL